MVHNQVLAQAFAMECIPYGPYRLGSVTCWRKHSQFCAVYCNQVLGVRRLAQARETGWTSAAEGFPPAFLCSGTGCLVFLNRGNMPFGAYHFIIIYIQFVVTCIYNKLF